jgi:predicted amidohydrolase YtcJ
MRSQMVIGRRQFLTAGIAGALASPLLAQSTRLDLALVGGSVWTGFSRVPRTDAIGISGDRIVAIGNDAVRAAITRTTRVVELKGAFVMPAFIDNHTHFLKGALALAQPELLTATSRTEFAERIGRAAKADPGQWITGKSWDEQRMGGELPTRAWIDAVTPDTPVAVPRTDLHMFLLNSVALRLAGVDRNTPDPDGGVIVRDSNGEPTGILKDNAKLLVQRVIPRLTPVQEDAAIRGAIAMAHSHGVAQVHVPEIDWNAHEALRRSAIARQQGMRFYSFVPLQDWRRIAGTVAQEGRGDGWLRWGAVKGLADGSLGSRTALFREPYTDDADTTGVRVMPLDELRQNVLDADKAGLQIAVHAIGDLANDDVLDIFKAVAAQNGPRDRRFRIEHAQHLRPASIPRFAQQGVIASVQPYHAIDDGRWAVKRIGEARLKGTYAFESLIRSGAHVTFGSDWPVAPLDPIQGIHAAVTRETLDGANRAGWLPDQKTTVEQALVAYTVANAYAGFQENRVGRIAPDYLADLVIIDRDLTNVAPDEIHKARVLNTFVAGQQRYEA